MKIHEMWHAYPELATDLEATLASMQKSIKLANKDVEQAILAMINSGGKLLRPAYNLLFAQFGSANTKEKSIALAAALETLHTATLIHDDVIDDATTRRGLPSIQAHFSKDIAVYAGDYLFITCFKLLAEHASSLKSIQLNSSSMEKILSGELGQMNMRYNTSTSVKQYIENISGKTAELFALSCFVGAYESGCGELFSNKCRKIGLAIGISFQIIDDILDYSQDATTLGKPVLEDVRQGVYSLPLLCGMSKNKEAFLPYLSKKELMTDADAQAVFELVQQYDGLADAQKLATDYTQKALKMIQKLPNNEHHTKEVLYTITEQILIRNH